MKLLFDFLPIVLFFGTFKYAESHKEWAAEFATRHLGAVVAGGSVGATQAPVLLATVVVIAATLAQVLWLKSRGRKVDTMLWVSLGIIAVMGGLTLLLHDETFIKWKPTVLYWLFGAVLAGSALLFRKNLIRKLMEGQIRLPDRVWDRLNASWIGFFVLMGAANLFVAYTFSTDAWVNFKLFGGMGLMLAFVVAQSLLLARHIEEDGK